MLAGLFSAQGTVRSLGKPSFTVDPDKAVLSAELRLYQTFAGGVNDTVNIYRMLVDWSETGANWLSNGVAAGTWTASGLQAGVDYAANPTDTQPMPALNSYAVFDVTSDAQAWAAGTANYGWLIRNQNEAAAGNLDLVSFRTRELGPGVEPLLVFEQVTAGSVRTNAFIADTYIESNTPTANHGTEPTTVAGLFSVQGTVRALCKPALFLDPAKLVLSAEVYLFQSWQYGTNDTVNLHRMLVDWTETGATWQSTGAGAATWSAAGLLAGVDYVATATDSQLTPPDNFNYVVFDVTSDVRAWADGADNFGWLVKNQNEAAGGNLDLVSFRTLSYAFENGGPMLVVEQGSPAGSLLLIQ